METAVVPTRPTTATLATPATTGIGMLEGRPDGATKAGDEADERSGSFNDGRFPREGMPPTDGIAPPSEGIDDIDGSDGIDESDGTDGTVGIEESDGIDGTDGSPYGKEVRLAASASSAAKRAASSSAACASAASSAAFAAAASSAAFAAAASSAALPPPPPPPLLPLLPLPPLRRRPLGSLHLACHPLRSGAGGLGGAVPAVFATAATWTRPRPPSTAAPAPDQSATRRQCLCVLVVDGHVFGLPSSDVGGSAEPRVDEASDGPPALPGRGLVGGGGPRDLIAGRHLCGVIFPSVTRRGRRLTALNSLDRSKPTGFGEEEVVEPVAEAVVEKG